MKAVFDTNVLFAALVTPGICARLLVRARRREFMLVISPRIREELERALVEKLPSTKAEVRQALQLIDEVVGEVCQPLGLVQGACRDPDDDHVLDCLLTSGSLYLVTGDADLLTLVAFKGAPIVSPRDFEALFRD